MYAGRLALLLSLQMLTGNAFAYDLDQHLWQDRLLFLVAPTAEDVALRHKRALIERRADAFADRDMVLFQLHADGGSRDHRTLDATQVRQLRAQLHLDEQDRVMILIGKDGGIKRRAPLAADLRGIFVQIDAMPMRQAEMRARQQAGQNVTQP